MGGANRQRCPPAATHATASITWSLPRRDVDGRKRVGKDDADGSEWETDSDEGEAEGGGKDPDGPGEEGAAGAAEKVGGGVSYLAARATDVGVGPEAGRPLPRGVRQA